VLGVNRYCQEGASEKIEVHAYDPTTAERQVARTRRVRAERDEGQVQALLDKLAAVAKNPDDNIMPVTVELVRAGATMGDIVEKLKGVWGIYRETPVF
jgi:methylmalonyl-CoA mutase N-terminal domain/subunit